ncbi:autotransporter outer membrane beta-barrel domain-containing protein [Acidithiobacillus thiooxidans]|uniref:Autotransporter domain-containing protein n=1 Tax=Acidithiobacillus thiooxidans TaxID=930 RepID=A0A1C2IHZ0_ACITH|nr:autotransporter outer membrane beta-barrel domain-containing protein [Acidithiobacillus thiooxidans]OCX75603.1 hypothetical protein A6M23_02315 [Acidithiobacillus thiooxidans]OCX80649.1 hypothetical protein A6P08_15755 [Acidithiobacillus thiooxidans]
MNSVSTSFRRRTIVVAVSMALVMAIPVAANAAPQIPTSSGISNYDGGGGSAADIDATSGTTTTSQQSTPQITFDGGNVDDTYDAGSLGTGDMWVDDLGVSLEQNGTLTTQAGNLNITGDDSQSGFQTLDTLTVQNTSTPDTLTATTTTASAPYDTNVYLSGVDPLNGGLVDDTPGNLGFGEFESGGVLYGNATNNFGGPAANRIPLSSLTLGSANSGQISLFDSTVNDAGNLTVNDAAGLLVAGVGGDSTFYSDTDSVVGPAIIENLASGGYINFSSYSFAASSLDLLAPKGMTYFQSLSVNLGGTGTMTINPGVDAGGMLAVDGNVVNQGGNFFAGGGLSVSGDLTQTSGDLYLTVTPSTTLAATNGAPITSAKQYNVSDGNVFIDAYDGKDTNITSPFPNSLISSGSGSFANGDKWALIESTGGTGAANTFNPSNVYYVYDGSQSSKIAGFQPYLSETSSQVDLCLGSTCVSQPSQPTKSKPTKTKTPAPVQTKTHAPAPAPAPVKTIPVQVVTPVQEAKPILADATNLNLHEARAAADTILSTGIVGGAPRGLWFKGLGGSQSQCAYRGANYGLIAGYGWSVGPKNRDVAGIAFSAEQSGMGTSANDYAKSSSYGLWAYGAYYPTHRVTLKNGWKLAGTIGGGISTNTIASTALGLPQTAHFGGSFLGLEARASYWKHYGNWVLSPRLSVGFNDDWTDAFNTHGASFLDVHGSTASDSGFLVEPAVLIGKKFVYRTAAGYHTIFPQVRLGLVQNIGPTPGLGLSSGDVSGSVQGLAYPHTQGMAELRLDVTSHTRYSKGLSGNISVRQLFGGGAAQTEAIASLKYLW